MPRPLPLAAAAALGYLAGTLPYIWGSSEIAGVAAHRLACQLAENAKYPAVSGELPEVQQAIGKLGAIADGVQGHSAGRHP